MTNEIPSPCYVLEETRLQQNLELLQLVQQRADVSIILALKAYALWHTFPLIKKYLDGGTASSLHEARLINEEMGVRAHIYAPAYIPYEFDQILKYCSHITFNSINQYLLYQAQIAKASLPVSAGLRVNPEYSGVKVDMYNPCAPGSRFGETHERFKNGLPSGIEGIHFHTLCESDSYELEKSIASFEKYFSHLLPHIKWLNMGGGHAITRKDYDVDHLIFILNKFKKKHPHLKIILEPGAAIAWNTGYLVTTVLDIFDCKGIKTAIIDASFTAHMPDTLEMPYMPEIIGAEVGNNNEFAYRIGSISCLSGDYLNEYSFTKELQVGDRLTFTDQIHYTMVKTTTFNGVTHPAIAIKYIDGRSEIVRTFGYEDFKNRLG